LLNSGYIGAFFSPHRLLDFPLDRLLHFVMLYPTLLTMNTTLHSAPAIPFGCHVGPDGIARVMIQKLLLLGIIGLLLGLGME
jgi:hypothetical protein